MQNREHNLITLCIKGNQNAQMQLYDQYCGAMFTVACRYLKNEEDAKDAMQEGFLKAFKNLTMFQPDATFGVWLKRIIINQCLDVLKKNTLQFSDDNLMELTISEDENWEFDVAITKNDILLAIDQLDAKHRMVVKLYLIEGYDHQEISEILEIAKETSRTHLRRGKIKLKDLLKRKYNEAIY